MLHYFQSKEESYADAKDTKKKGYKQSMHSKQWGMKENKWKLVLRRTQSRIWQPTRIQWVQENAENNPRIDREKEKILKLSWQNKQLEREISHCLKMFQTKIKTIRSYKYQISTQTTSQTKVKTLERTSTK